MHDWGGWRYGSVSLSKSLDATSPESRTESDRVDEILREIQELVDGFVNKAAELQTIEQWSKNPQYPREATDQSRSVQVTLATNNLPKRVTVLSTWATSDTRLDEAIIEAMAIAATAAWERAEEEFRAGNNPPTTTASELRDSAPAASSDPVGLGELFELSQEFQDSATSAGDSTSVVANSAKTVTIKVGRLGLIDLRIDQKWAVSQSSHTLDSEINQTFDLAHQALEQLVKSSQQRESATNEILSQVLGYMNAITEGRNPDTKE